jgi:hypothetical protein
MAKSHIQQGKSNIQMGDIIRHKVMKGNFVVVEEIRSLYGYLMGVEVRGENGELLNFRIEEVK